VVHLTDEAEFEAGEGGEEVWVRTCSAVMENERPLQEIFFQPSAFRKYRSAAFRERRWMV
jgi:hypothetical protein